MFQLTHRNGADNAEIAQRISNASVSLCVLRASAVNFPFIVECFII